MRHSINSTQRDGPRRRMTPTGAFRAKQKNIEQLGGVGFIASHSSLVPAGPHRLFVKSPSGFDLGQTHGNVAIHA